MNCIYLRKRQKKYQPYKYCTIKKEKIEYDECKKCDFKEYKKFKPIKAVSKKRITVSKKTYNIVLQQSKGRCALCEAYDNLEYHHIYYRSERKDLIDDASNGLMLCHREFSKNKCHKKVHSNKKKYQPLLLKIKKKIS